MATTAPEETRRRAVAPLMTEDEWRAARKLALDRGVPIAVLVGDLLREAVAAAQS